MVSRGYRNMRWGPRECCGGGQNVIHIHQSLTGVKCKQAKSRPLEKANNQNMGTAQLDGTPSEREAELKYPVSCYSSEIGVMNF